MVPLFSLSQFPLLTPTSSTCVWGYRWLLFRIMIGAGLIKLRGDKCWLDLTCMEFFYETQPVPNPISPFLHNMPKLFHSIETFSNHIIELLVPFLVFLPRPFRVTSGCIQILFQLVLIMAGNLSFLNWLTMAPAVMYLDDYSYRCLFSIQSQKRAILAQSQYEKHVNSPFALTNTKFVIYIQRLVSIVLFVVLSTLSYPVVLNLFSKAQAMNTSYNSFRIVNTYGAFGSVTKTRTEVIFEGTSDSIISKNTQWKEFHFKCKPGDINRRPCFISPYHYRLDWSLW